MDFGIKGKTALVAASSQGLGRAVAEELAAEGANLVLCARNETKLREAAIDIEKISGISIEPVVADLTDPDGVKKVAQAGRKKFGSIDILVTNTGGPPPGNFESLSMEDWDSAVRQNLNSVLHLVRHVLPDMKKKRWGRILNVTSVSVKQPVENLMLSNSIRAAVTGFARTLANEVAVFGITVNNILPGYTSTSRLRDLAKHLAGVKKISVEAVFGEWEAQVPMKRIGTAREFAALAAFLVSERASYITGTSIPVDGGIIKALF